MMPVLQGIQFGLLLALMVGPVFFTILQTSLQHGFKRAMFLILGISLSDLFIILLCYLGLGAVMANEAYQQYTGIAGGLLLLGFGLHHLLFGKAHALPNDPVKERNHTRYVVKGFLINGMTPTVLLFWLATFSLVSVQFGYRSSTEYLLFFGGVLVTVLCTDMLKAWLAGRLRSFVTPRLLRGMQVVLGIVLAAFGGRMLWVTMMS